MLEALALGVPVLTSRVSSLPEVGGDAVAYVDPMSQEAIGAELLALLTDPERRSELRSRGAAQAAKFSWEQTARLTLSLYDKLAQRS